MKESTQKSFQLTPELKKEMEKIVPLYATKRAALLPVLNLLQKEHGFISPEIEGEVAQFLGLPLMQVREVVSFYTLFYTHPKGKYHFQVCRNLSCTLKGCEEIINHLKSRLGIDSEQNSQDGRFSLSTVECLGACEVAPMMQLNEKYVGNLTKKSIDELLNTLK
jgi:NADH-quinone oxidoreductase E subunit